MRFIIKTISNKIVNKVYKQKVPTKTIKYIYK